MVIDNVEVKIKGHASQRDPKVSWKFHLPQGHDLDMRGCSPSRSTSSTCRPTGATSPTAGPSCRGTPTSAPASPTTRCSRSGPSATAPSRASTTSTTSSTAPGASARATTNHQFFEAETSAFERPGRLNVQFCKKAPDDDRLRADLRVRQRRPAHRQRPARLPAGQRRPPGDDQLRGRHRDHRAPRLVVEELLPGAGPTTGRWSILPWDLDHTWGNGCCNVNSTFVTPAEPGDNTSALMRALLAVPEWRDDVLPPAAHAGQRHPGHRPDEALYDATSRRPSRPRPWTIAAWPYPATPRYATFRTRLFNDIQARRNVFATDSRVPGNQPPPPNIVIDEIQHSPDQRRHRGVRGALQPRTPRPSTSPAGPSPAASTWPSSPAPSSSRSRR